MEFLSQLGSWISENEALLSGIAAMIVVAGVVFTPLGVGFRRLLRDRGGGDKTAAAESSANAELLAGSPAPIAPVANAPADRPSIAVLPFVNMSADTEQEFLADGMTEDVITGLAATRHLYVVSRNSAFAYKGQSPDIRSVGRELGVRYVLEGSLRRVSENLRTTAQLIEASSGNHLWAERYDRRYSDIVEDQDEVVSEIAGALAVQIEKAEIWRSRRQPPSDIGAWELVQRGLWDTMESPCIERSRGAVARLKAAVELDPDYTYARAAYAWGLFTAAINGFTDEPVDAVREGRLQLMAALEGDTADPLTQFYLGAAYLYSGSYERGVYFFEQSLAQNPHQPHALAHLALARAYLGDFPRAYATFERADRITPRGITASSYYTWYRGIALCLDERFAEAIPIVSEVLEHIPRYATARITLAIALEGVGNPDRARAEVERASQLDPGLCVDGLAMNIGAHPDREKGRARVALLRRYWPG